MRPSFAFLGEFLAALEKACCAANRRSNHSQRATGYGRGPEIDQLAHLSIPGSRAAKPDPHCNPPEAYERFGCARRWLTQIPGASGLTERQGAPFLAPQHAK